MNPFKFDIRNLTEEGKQVTGTLPATFFQLAEGDTVKAESSLTYDLTFQREGKDVIVTGRLEALFTLECGRCLQNFQFGVVLEDYQAEVPIEKETTMDLTDMVREDILLALPNYPRCEDGNIEPRDCPAEGSFDTADREDAEEPPTGADQGVWNVLDKLN